MPKVSVIIPTYNRGDGHLIDSVKSVLGQNYMDFEIIISDNASTDNTQIFVESLSDKRIIYHKNEVNLGMTANYNKTLELCSGEYIQFFSDDDIMMQDCLQSNVEILDHYQNVGLVHSDIKIIDSAGEIISNYHWGTLVWRKWSSIHAESKLFNKELYHKYLYRIHNLISMPTVMIRKSIIEKIGFMDTNIKFYIDLDYWLKITLFQDVYYINKKLVFFRIHSKNTTSQVSSYLSNQIELAYIRKNLKERFPQTSVLTNDKFYDVLQKSGFYSNYSFLGLFKFMIKMMLNGIKAIKK